VEERNNLTRDEARARGGLATNLRYEIELDLTTGGEHFRSDTRIAFDSPQPGAETFLDLIATEVESIELNGEAVDTAAFDGVRVQLPPLAERNEVRVVANVAYSHVGAGMHRFVDPVDDRVYTYSDFEPFDAHRVFACFDQPDLKGVFRFTVVAPGDWEVVSNMAAAGEPASLDGDASDGTPLRRWTFAPTPPISTYITAVVAGPYHVERDTHGSIPLGLYVRRSLAQHLEADELFELTKQGFEFFERAFDYPYPFDKYDQVMVPEFNSGAMENAGCVTFNESYVFRSKVTDSARERRAETILHEMAHMWFGDLVTMRWWDDLWLNETFATFMSVWAQVDNTRFTNGWTTFANAEKTWAYMQDQLPSTHPITADMPDTESIHTNFDGITYAKGASVMRQLVAWVGDEEFLRGLRAYFRTHEWGNTDLSDFLSALEEASGRDLHAWSKEWLQTAGVNVLRASFEEAGDGTFGSFAVTQTAPAEWPILRPHRVAVGLYDDGVDGLSRRRRVELDVTGTRTDVPELVGEKMPDLVLVNDGDLAYARIRLDPRSLATVRDRLGNLHDSLARALCWGATWDMVRDGEMRTRDFLELVLGQAEAEDDVGVVQRVVGQVAGAIDLYGDPANADAARERLARGALQSLETSEPGSGFQLAWVRAFASAARSDEHVAILRGLLDGSRAYDGLSVDTELRWHLVMSLAAGGRDPDGALARAELERDPTDQGQRHAAAVLAARPTEQAKREAWERMTTDESLNNATLGALIRGFQQPGQASLLEAYVEPYFEVLGRIWKERRFEFALTFARGMYPGLVVDEAVAERTERYLEEASPAGPVRRTLSESRDGVLRALRARACDAGEDSAATA
jgi:aminopeptidase N